MFYCLYNFFGYIICDTYMVYIDDSSFNTVIFKVGIRYTNKRPRQWAKAYRKPWPFKVFTYFSLPVLTSLQ
jgi:hypothetical protein